MVFLGNFILLKSVFMDKEINKKIQVLMQKAGEGKAYEKKDKKITDSHIPNSLADNIKTKEQANAFMLLLKNL